MHILHKLTHSAIHLEKFCTSVAIPSRSQRHPPTCCCSRVRGAKGGMGGALGPGGGGTPKVRYWGSCDPLSRPLFLPLPVRP